MLARLAAELPIVGRDVMKYIIGMAKSPLDARGGKGRNLELDFLRLLLAVRHLGCDGNSAQGYLLVLTPELGRLAERWHEKYDAGPAVKILVGELDASTRSRLEAEKQANARGSLPKSLDSQSGDSGDSVAGLGKKTGEDSLRAEILKLEPNAREANGVGPFRVNWDFFGIVGVQSR